MAYGQGQEDSSTQALEVFGEKQGEVDVNQLMEMLKVLLPLIMQQVANPAQLTFEGKKNLMAKQVPAPQGMAQLPARGMQGPPMPQPQGPPTPLHLQLGMPRLAGRIKQNRPVMRPAPGHTYKLSRNPPGTFYAPPKWQASGKGYPSSMQPSMIPRVPQVRPQGGGGGGNMLQMLMQMMRGGR